MALWSRSQSQSAGARSPIASSQFGKVKALGNLQPVAYKVKVANIREAKRADRLAREASGELEVVKVRDYFAPIKAGHVAKGWGRRAERRNGLTVGLSGEKLAIVQNKRAINAAFHVDLKASLKRGAV